MYTYAVVVKKTYQDLSTSLSTDVYEVPKVFDNEDDAQTTLLDYIAYSAVIRNKIDVNGLITDVDVKTISLEGNYSIEQVKALLNVAGPSIWNKGKRAR
jgi:xanthine dehydrogenase molybdopterin-binding subunit B